jgi:flagellar protein FlgJ
MHGSFQPLLPINGQSMNGLDPTFIASTSPFSQALSMNPDIAVKAAGQVGAGGIAPLHQNSAMSLNAAPTHTPEEMKKVAKQFESIFIRMLMKEMRSTLEKNPMVGNSRAMEMFQSMQDDQFAERMSDQGMGIGDMVYRQMMSDSLKHNQRIGNGSV